MNTVSTFEFLVFKTGVITRKKIQIIRIPTCVKNCIPYDYRVIETCT